MTRELYKKPKDTALTGLPFSRTWVGQVHH